MTKMVKKPTAQFSIENVKRLDIERQGEDDAIAHFITMGGHYACSLCRWIHPEYFDHIVKQFQSQMREVAHGEWIYESEED